MVRYAAERRHDFGLRRSRCASSAPALLLQVGEALAAPALAPINGLTVAIDVPGSPMRQQKRSQPTT
jgi:hypothetical protein